MLLSACDITKTYGTGAHVHQALQGVSISVDASEMVGLIGESGSGKSTLAHIICALEVADGGTVTFDGVTMDAAQQLKRTGPRSRATLAGMQLIFQNPQASFSPRMRVGAAVAEGLIYYGATRAQARDAALRALTEVGLSAEHAKAYAWQLSGGQAQRAAIARAIVSQPKLLICDEPTSALDVTVQAQVVNLLVRLCNARNMVCLFISHDLALVRALCSRAYVMRAGVVVEQGPTNQLFCNPAHPYTRSLVAAAPAL